MNFGNNLKKIRQEKEMTQEELAKKINTSRSNIANYENDKNMPSIEILNNLSEALNCSTDYLLGKSDKKTNTSDIDNLDKKFICALFMDKYQQDNLTGLKNVSKVDYLLIQILWE